MFAKGVESAYERALQRAHDEHLEIIEDGCDHDGSLWFHVRNPAHDGYYTVCWAMGARVLTCNCEAGQRAVLCKHRSLVHDELTFRKQLDELVAAAQFASEGATIL